MKITDEDKEKAEKWWGNRNIVKELEYCGNNIKDRRGTTNVDLQFYAYIMRKAAALLRKEERKADEQGTGESHTNP